MNDPIDRIQPALPRKSFGESPQYRQDAFTTAVDLGQFNHQRIRTQPDLSEYFRRPDPEDDRADGHQSGNVIVGERKDIVHLEAFDQYPPRTIWLLAIHPLSLWLLRCYTDPPAPGGSGKCRFKSI
jgi:hypothetical protein